MLLLVRYSFGGLLLLVRYSFGGLPLLVRYSFGGGAATRPLLVRRVAATRPLLVRRGCCYSSATRPRGVLVSWCGARARTCSSPWVLVGAMCSCHSAVLVPRTCSWVEHGQAPLVFVAVLLRCSCLSAALNKGPRAQERAQRAESPRAACIAQRRTREGPSRASPWTWRHTDAWRRGGSLHRAQRKERQTADERRDDSHHTHAASPARLRQREPPDRLTHTGARARAARASPVAMRAGNGLAPRGAASEEKPRDDDDADRQRVENTTTTTDRRVHLDVRKPRTHAERRASTARRQSS